MYTSPMDGPCSPDIFRSAQDLSSLTATQKELLSDRKSWPEMLSRNFRVAACVAAKVFVRLGETNKRRKFEVPAVC